MARQPKGEAATNGIARNLMHVLADAVVKIRAGLLPHEQAIKYEHLTAYMEDMERDIAPLMRSVFGELADNPDIQGPIRPILDLLVNNENQFNIVLDLAGVIGGIFVVLPQLGQILSLPSVQQLWTQHPNIVLSPALVADAINRGIIDYNDGLGIAMKSGVQDPTLGQMVKLTGEPPGPIDMINLWRWGRITEAELDKGLLFSRLNDEFLPMIKKLAVGFMSPADAVELAVKGVRTPDDAKALFVLAGGEPDQWQDLFEGAGDSVGNEQAIGLYNQGLITEAQLLQVFGRSRLNPIFYPIAELLRHKFLQPYQISAMLRGGTATPQQAAKWLTSLGYGEEQVAAFTSAASTGTVAKAKTETEAMVLAEYQDRIIDATTAHDTLVKIGYQSDQANMLIALEDAKLAKSERDTAVGGVRAAFVANKITHDQAESDLQTLGVPAPTITGYLAAWAVEATTKIKTLTVAEIAKAAKAGLITWADVVTRYQAMGYNQLDAEILAGTYGGGPLVPNSGP